MRRKVFLFLFLTLTLVYRPAPSAAVDDKPDHPPEQIFMDTRVLEFFDDASLDVAVFLNHVYDHWWRTCLSMRGARKPIIYPYSETTTDISVKLDYRGTLEHTWPVYDDAWKVTAYSDRTLISHVEGEEYSCLFWEEKTDVEFDLSIGFSSFLVRGADTETLHSSRIGFRKPVICLYPEKTTDVSVKLDYRGTLEYTWPVYDDGWRVTAHPDGTLVNHADGEEYSYLFWEGRTDVQFDLSRGFVVRGADTATFLREKLAFMGLTPREYNEFIVYWLPLMEKNAWNLIAFQDKVYTDNAVLTITPKPDSLLRVYMAFKPLPYPITVPPQELKPFERKGFTVVEWGGSAVGK